MGNLKSNRESGARRQRIAQRCFERICAGFRVICFDNSIDDLMSAIGIGVSKRDRLARQVHLVIADNVPRKRHVETIERAVRNAVLRRQCCSRCVDFDPVRASRPDRKCLQRILRRISVRACAVCESDLSAGRIQQANEEPIRASRTGDGIKESIDIQQSGQRAVTFLELHRNAVQAKQLNGRNAVRAGGCGGGIPARETCFRHECTHHVRHRVMTFGGVGVFSAIDGQDPLPAC